MGCCTTCEQVRFRDESDKAGDAENIIKRIIKVCEAIGIEVDMKDKVKLRKELSLR